MTDQKIEIACAFCQEPIFEGQGRTRIGSRDYCEFPTSCYLKYLESKADEGCPNETKFKMGLQGKFLIDRDTVKKIE